MNREENRIYQREWARKLSKEQPELARERRRKAYQRWRENHPDYVRKKKWLKDTLKQNYNMTQEQYNQLLDDQQGVCAICGQEETSRGHPRLSVDHDHETKIIRGLLCHRCNVGLGCFKDDITRLEKAINYLKLER